MEPLGDRSPAGGNRVSRSRRLPSAERDVGPPRGSRRIVGEEGAALPSPRAPHPPSPAYDTFYERGSFYVTRSPVPLSASTSGTPVASGREISPRSAWAL